jgi:hypothetical protein
MKKLTLLAVVALAALLVGTGCDMLASLDKPNVTASAVTNGTVLRLNWVAITDANEYEIVTDDTTYVATAPSTEWDLTVPTKSVKVYAKNGDTRSDPAEIDCEVEETSSVILYGITDPEPTHPSGLAFTTAGAAVAMSLDSANWAALDFVCDDRNFACAFVNPGDYTPPYNSKGNALNEAATTNYDDLDIVATTNYITQLELAQGGLYSLWIDPTNNGWDDADHFAKMSVQTIEDVSGHKKATVKIGYQKIPGLRWVMN